jgi:hypothetical protein
VDDLRGVLEKGRGQAKRSLASCPEVHFARWALLERPRAVPALGAGTLLPAIETPSLLFATTFDGPRADHLANLARSATAWLDRVYTHCWGYPAPAPGRRAQSIVDYLARHRIPAHTFFVGTPGVSVADAHGEAALRDQIEGFLDYLGALPAEDPVHFHLLARQNVRAVPALTALLQPPEPVRPRGPVGWVISRIRKYGGTPRWFPPPGLLRWTVLGFARQTELSDQPPPPGQVFPFPDPSWLGSQIQRMRKVEHEDRNGTNRLTVYSDVKPGLFRRLLLRGSLFFLDGAARATLDGRLSGTEGIHSARWVVVERGRRLLFLSNYDGSWEEYLTAFSKNFGVARGVTSIWSSAQTFPRTNYLVCGGAIHEKPFKEAVRANQIATQFWYSAYKDPRFTVEFINRNRRIRRGLAKPALSLDEATRWLAEFG